MTRATSRLRPDPHVVFVPLSAPGDFNSGSHSDILLRNTNGQAVVWQMNGTHMTSGAFVGRNPGSSWHTIDAGDTNGDGKFDLVLRHDNGTLAVWELDGTHYTEAGIAGAPGADWLVV